MVINKRTQSQPILDKEIYALSVSNPISLPLGLEYERLEKQLNHIDDHMEKEIPLSYMSNKINNQSAINFDEPNTKAPYPLSTIPYSQGIVWE